MDWLEPYPRRLAYFHDRGPLLATPELLVVHSGATGANVAGYLENPRHPEDAALKTVRLSGRVPRDKLWIVTDARGRRLQLILGRDDVWRRPVSAHFSAPDHANRYHQQVPLSREAWHAGGSVWRPGARTNAISWSVEEAGPANQRTRPPEQRERLRRLAGDLKAINPRLQYWTRHSDIQPGKTDPGPGVLDTWLEGILTYQPRTGVTRC